MPGMSRYPADSNPDAMAASLPSALAAIAARHAHRPALAAPDLPRALTFAELTAQADALAAALPPTALPAVCAILLPTSAAHVVALLGALGAGYAWLSLDPDYPDERLVLMLAETAPPLLITSGDWAARAAALAPSARIVRWPGPSLPLSPPRSPPPFPTDPWRPACVFFTSGSTGRPKSAVHPHANIMADIARQTHDLAITAADRFDLLFSASFSAFLSPVFGALLTGASVHLFPLRLRSAADLRDWLEDTRISVSTMSVSGYRRLVSSPPRHGFPALRVLSVGAEPLARADYATFSRRFPPTCRLQNALATTETRTIAQDLHPASSAPPAAVSVGLPVTGKKLELRDPAGSPVPAGATGEIVVTGEHLSPGGWDFFLALPGRTLGGPRRVVHRTGDLGRFLPDGRLVHLGRLDDQLKIRGHRVEPLEVEAALLRLPGIANAAVGALPAAGGTAALAALLVAAADPPPTPASLHAALARTLPPYAVPSRFHFVTALPATPSGKLDRRALPAAFPPLGPAEPAAAHPAPANSLLATVLAVWSRVLGHQLTADDDFFASGGDSLTAVEATTALSAALVRPLSPGLLVEGRTARTLAQVLARADDVPGLAFRPLRPGRADRPSLYLLPPWNQSSTLFRDFALTTPSPNAGPWFSLEAFDLPGQPPLDTIEAVADRLLPALLTRHPDSAFVLAGFSAAGFVAWELGRQLEARGRRDVRIILLDCPRDHAWLTAPERHAVARAKLPRVRIPRLLGYLVFPRGRSRRVILHDLFIGKIRWLLGGRRRWRQRPPDPYAVAFANNIRLSENYHVQPLGLPVGLLRARFQAGWSAKFQPDLGWAPHCRGPFALREVAASHVNQLFAPHAGTTAALLEALADRP